MLNLQMMKTSLAVMKVALKMTIIRGKVAKIVLRAAYEFNVAQRRNMDDFLNDEDIEEFPSDSEDETGTRKLIRPKSTSNYSYIRIIGRHRRRRRRPGRRRSEKKRRQKSATTTPEKDRSHRSTPQRAGTNNRLVGGREGPFV